MRKFLEQIGVLVCGALALSILGFIGNWASGGRLAKMIRAAILPEIEFLEEENKKTLEMLREMDSRIKAIGAATSELEQPFVGGGEKVWTATSRCPDGYYVVAVKGRDHDTGRYCYDCMSKFGVICRPLQ